MPGVSASEERGYWRDVGTHEALAAFRRNLLGPRPRLCLDNPAWRCGPKGLPRRERRPSLRH